MKGVGFADVLGCKVVDCKYEDDGAVFMLS